MSLPRVLVVDDHHELAQLLASALEAQGAEVRVAQDGHEALEAIASTRFDAALVDLLLPDMLGTEVLDALGEADPPVPALAMSGVFRGDRYHRDAVITHGAKEFFEKPFNTQQVVWRVLELTGRIPSDDEDILLEEGEILGEADVLGDADGFDLDLELAPSSAPPQPPQASAPRPAPPPLPVRAARIDPDLPYEPSLSGVDEPMLLDSPTGELTVEDEPLFEGAAKVKWKRDDSDGLAAAAAAALESAFEPPIETDRYTPEEPPAPPEASTPEEPPAPPEASTPEASGRHVPTFVGADEGAEAAGQTGSADRTRRRMGFVEDLIPVGGAPAGRPADEATRRDPSMAVTRAPGSTAPVSTTPAPPSRPDPRGDLSTTSVPRLLAALHQTRFTGALKLTRDETAKIVHLRDGRPVFATSGAPEDALLTYAVRADVVRAADAETARNLAREERRRVGELLVELELLDRSGVRALVAAQARDIVWSTFAWTGGAFALLRDPAADKKPRVIDEALGRLVIAGLARLPLAVLRSRMPDDAFYAPRAAPVVGLEELDLTGPEARLVTAADGTKTVRDLVTLAEFGEAEVRGLLVALAAFDLLGPKEQVELNRRRVGFVI